MSAVIDRGTVAATTKRIEPEGAENPRTRRFGINPAIPILEVHQKLSGRQEANIPYGFPIRFETFNGMSVPRWDVDPESKEPPNTFVDLTAYEAITNVRIAAWQGSRDMGFRELAALTVLEDDEAYNLLDSIFPPLDSSLCLYPDENTREVRMERIVNDVAVVERVQVFSCVTCTIKWLESYECEMLADSPYAMSLRTQLLDAYWTTKTFFVAKWSEWVSEMARREKGENGLSVLGEEHLHVMRQLHEIEPSKQAAAMLAENQDKQANAIREGLQDVVRGLQPQQTVDVEAIIKRAKEEWRAEMDAEKIAPEEPKKKSNRQETKA